MTLYLPPYPGASLPLPLCSPFTSTPSFSDGSPLHLSGQGQAGAGMAPIVSRRQGKEQGIRAICVARRGLSLAPSQQQQQRQQQGSLQMKERNEGKKLLPSAPCSCRQLPTLIL